MFFIAEKVDLKGTTPIAIIEGVSYITAYRPLSNAARDAGRNDIHVDSKGYETLASAQKAHPALKVMTAAEILAI
jgi:hypothetical protein